MNATARHRADDAAELPVTRVLPISWLFAIIGAIAVGWGGLTVTVQGLAREQEKQAIAQEKQATSINAKIDKLSTDAVAGGLTIKGYEFELGDLKRRVTALEAKR